MASSIINKKTITRHSFAKAPLKTDYPDFLEIQLKSFIEFFQLETTPDKRANDRGVQ